MVANPCGSGQIFIRLHFRGILYNYVRECYVKNIKLLVCVSVCICIQFIMLFLRLTFCGVQCACLLGLMDEQNIRKASH